MYYKWLVKEKKKNNESDAQELFEIWGQLSAKRRNIERKKMRLLQRLHTSRKRRYKMRSLDERKTRKFHIFNKKEWKYPNTNMCKNMYVLGKRSRGKRTTEQNEMTENITLIWVSMCWLVNCVWDAHAAFREKKPRKYVICVCVCVCLFFFFFSSSNTFTHTTIFW